MTSTTAKTNDDDKNIKQWNVRNENDINRNQKQKMITNRKPPRK